MALAKPKVVGEKGAGLFTCWWRRFIVH